MFDLLAQAATASADIPAWLISGGSLFGPGFTVWYAWNTTYKTIPGIIEQHRQERREMLEAHRQEREQTLAHFRQSLDLIQARYEADITRLIEFAKAR